MSRLMPPVRRRFTLLGRFIGRQAGFIARSAAVCSRVFLPVMMVEDVTRYFFQEGLGSGRG